MRIAIVLALMGNERWCVPGRTKGFAILSLTPSARYLWASKQGATKKSFIQERAGGEKHSENS